MNNRWNDQKIETVLTSTINRSSNHFERAADAMFESFKSANPNDSNIVRFPARRWITTAAAAVVVLGLLSVTALKSPTGPEMQSINYEDLVAMDEALQDGLGALQTENLEALQSISWMIENS